MRNLWTDSTTLAVTCGRGIAPFLQQELKALGYEILGATDTMVGIRAKNACRDILRLNLSLRTAQRVLWPFVQDTRCRTLEDLYRLAFHAPWEQVLSVDESFFVNNATRDVSTVTDTRMPTLKVKDAIVDRMRAKCGRRPNIGDHVPVRVVADGRDVYNKRTPLRSTLRVVRAVLEDWLNTLPAEQERVELLIEVDGYDLMSGSFYLPKLDLMVLRKRFERMFGTRITEGTPGAAIFVYWEGQHAKIYLDTSGNSLSRRGYRKEGWLAPMQEALAAACIIATGWDERRPFIVPFSGSGTPAIEAAMMARKILPGTLRADYAFMHLRGWEQIIPGEKAGESVRKRFGASPREIWREMVAQAKSAEIPFDAPGLPLIVGVDWEDRAVEIAEQNANRAGVGQNVKFFADDYSDSPLPKTPGILFMNPPYGERLENEVALESLYTGIGQWLHDRVPAGWQAWVFTSSRSLSLKIRLQTSAILQFKNGALDCRLIRYDIHAPQLTDVTSSTDEATSEMSKKMVRKYSSSSMTMNSAMVEDEHQLTKEAEL